METEYTQEEWETFLKVLKVVSKDPFEVPDVMTMKGLIAKIYKKARKDNRKANEKKLRSEDLALKESTLIANLPENKLPLLEKPKLLTENIIINKKLLKRPTSCYICKEPFTELHFFYQQLCPTCAEFNFFKRTQRTDLSGRTVLLTGGRIKIGYNVALKLLRDGARVIVTTRFPNDAITRFVKEADYSEWEHRLKIYGLELRNLPLVETFVQHLYKTETSIDIIINNAAQTIKRPLEFYQHLIEKESELNNKNSKFLNTSDYTYNVKQYLTESISEKQNLLGNTSFPTNYYDSFMQQIDLREENSWVLTLDKINTMELLETHLVNAFAPFILNSKLKPLMMKAKFDKKFIVNVSAMEGQFNRLNKTEFHPHTNMAKAGLNMLTRTASIQYARDNIFMNSVDTGWITQENPYHKMVELRLKGFVPPLDIIDGASRIYAPIVSGLAGEIIFGKFLKDYKEYPW